MRTADDIQPSTGPDLAEERRRLGLTQQQVADKLGRNRVTVANLESRAFVSAIQAHNYRRALDAAKLVALGADGTAA